MPLWRWNEQMLGWKGRHFEMLSKRHREAAIMYLDDFHLKTKPFELRTEPRFLWVGANQRHALATLSYGLQENRGIVVLSGEFGTGKTTLVNAFVQSLDDTVLVAQLPDPGADPAHFRLAVAKGFGLQIAKPDLEGLMEALTRLADNQRCYRQSLLLVIDEAQGLTAVMQDDLLHMASREYRGHRLLHILLVGQNEIYQWAAKAKRDALQNQFSATCRLYPLSGNETAAYINLRLRVAGAVRSLFGDDAVRLIHSFSRGVPRAINLVCDAALLHASMEGADKVDAQIVDLCKERFQLAIREHWLTPEVSVRDLTTLPTEPQMIQQDRFWRHLGLSAFALLLVAVAGFWYYGAVIDTSLRQEREVSTKSSAVKPFPPPILSSYSESLEQVAPTETSQQAAAKPFVGQPIEAEQNSPLKPQAPPTETVAAPRPDASPTGDAEEI